MSSEHDLTPDAAQRRRLLALFGAAGLGALAPWQAALAQKGAWPERPINYVVPFPPGGLTDVAARQVGKALSDAERWNVVVENKPGGSANIGAAHVAHAAPDGYTWLAITLTHAANVTLFAGKAGYDLTRDLTLLAGLASSPIMVVVNAKSDIKTHGRPGERRPARKIAVGRVQRQRHASAPDPGALSEDHRAAHDAYRHIQGGAPSLTDLIGGHRDVVFSNEPESLSHVKNGSLRALAITTHERSVDLPDVPTVKEAGLPDLIVENFTGVLAPAGTPPELVKRIGNAIVAQVSRAGHEAGAAAAGLHPQPRGPGGVQRVPEIEVERWAKIIRDANIQIALTWEPEPMRILISEFMDAPAVDALRQRVRRCATRARTWSSGATLLDAVRRPTA